MRDQTLTRALQNAEKRFRPVIWSEARNLASRIFKKIRDASFFAVDHPKGFFAACLVAVLFLAFTGSIEAAETASRSVHIHDITSVEGVRNNSLIGYGMVVGLNSTGDRRQTLFSTQTLHNVLQRMGVQIDASQVQVYNVAAVLVTAVLPPFARPGTTIDVNVSSVGDAKSLEGGLLILTALHGADGQVYASAQGPVVLGGYTAGGRGNSLQINHPTAGRVPGGGIVEKDTSVNLGQMHTVSWLLRDSDFSDAVAVAAAINSGLGRKCAEAVDGRRVEVSVENPTAENVSHLIAQVENLNVTLHPRAKVVVNERNGTVVMGSEVTLGACSILHGNLAIDISTQYQVSQPEALSQGQTAVVPQTTVRTQDSPLRRIELPSGATVDDLIAGLQNIGATAHDMVAILEAVKAAGALEAELEVI